MAEKIYKESKLLEIQKTIVLYIMSAPLPLIPITLFSQAFTTGSIGRFKLKWVIHG